MISLIKEVLGVDDLGKSIYTLAKYNNGYFKSPTQAQFLKQQIDLRNGVVGSHEMYGNSVSVNVEYDNRGITKIYTHSSKTNRDVVKFTRKSDEEFSDLKATQIDNANKNFLDTISTYEKQIKEIEQEMQEVSDDLKAAMEQKPEKAESFQRILNSTVEKYQLRIADLEASINQLKAKIK